ncbi:hypothetical protein [Actinoplanes sp. L3-i22]|uniref:hypothetical protein n=1 Tax=Actinoplanes sp. L3-i22 TaxID=2836373 RepID=UPI001C864FA6|nr:hypothetical protein [Actinoplanes sp. L3-i22]
MKKTKLKEMAGAVADLMADRGFAFVENDRVEALAATLRAFLSTAGLPINPPEQHDDELEFTATSGRR